MLRDQVAQFNKHKGTVYSPWLAPEGRLRREPTWDSSVRMMERAFCFLGWTMDCDTPRWGGLDVMPEGRGEWDLSLEYVQPSITQKTVGGSSMLQDASREGWHWVSQLWEAPEDASGARMRTYERWK